MKKTYKCSDLYTATFEDGMLMTGTLDQLYAAQNNRRMAIKPVVWLWCSDSGLYMVDYILEGAPEMVQGTAKAIYKDVQSVRLDSKLLKTLHPDVYAECSSKTSYKRFSVV